MRSGIHPRSWWRLAAAMVATLGLAIPLAGSASAHASLVSSKPDDGATVTTAPSQVELSFDENIRRPSTVIVTAPDGRHMENGPVQILNATASLPLGEITAAGWYTIAYRVVSADGHPVFGQLSFRYAPRGETSAASAGTASPRSSGQSAAGAHGGHLVALGILIAAALVASFIAMRKDRKYDRPTTGG
jgi:copper resistance protein C